MTVQELQKDFANVLAKARRENNEVLIEEEGQPVAKLRPIAEKPKRRVPGSMKGKFVVPAEFFDPLPGEILRAFEGEG